MKLSICLLAALALGGCEVDPICLDCPDTGGLGMDGSIDGGADSAAADSPPGDVTLDVLGDGCVPEQCNGLDDDCDGMIDEDFDLSADVANCGACGAVCAPPHAFAACSMGTCAVASCDVGFHDIDGAAANGCEYPCIATGPDGLVCDGLDNNCDGVIDEGFDTTGDPLNCGACGQVCRFPHAAGLCVASTCAMGACDPNFYEYDMSTVNGCEYACTPAAPPIEVCNGLDDNCDGSVDEGNPGGGAACGLAIGECVAGREMCVSGVVACLGAIGPTTEVCNGLDDNCNGTTDEGFLTRVDNCGICGRVCSFPGGVAACVGGACRLAFCLPGFYNYDMNDANGCEYACVAAGTEVCNGVDDDCDGTTDMGISAPPALCSNLGVCMGRIPTCGGAAGWQCNYPATYETIETRCDGIDSNCDGTADESFPMRGAACGNGVGGCRRTGVVACTLDGLGVACNAPPAGAPGSEVCNGVDDDCDGAVDETRASPGASPSYVVDPMVRVNASLYVYSYEASRPDATATSAGLVSARSCSRSGVLPWTNLTHPQAVAACAASGMRLCTEAEWLTACQAAAGNCQWSYGSACRTYAGSTCNGNDYDPIPGPPDDDLLLTAGARPMCYADFGGAGRIYDMSGNAKEWAAARSAGVNALRGGSYNNTQNGIRCDFNFTLADDTFQLGNVGFRCCSSTAP